MCGLRLRHIVKENRILRLTGTGRLLRGMLLIVGEWWVPAVYARNVEGVHFPDPAFLIRAKQAFSWLRISSLIAAQKPL